MLMCRSLEILSFVWVAATCVSAGALDRRAACNRDNCLRAVVANNAKPGHDVGLADCSSFQAAHAFTASFAGYNATAGTVTTTTTTTVTVTGSNGTFTQIAYTTVDPTVTQSVRVGTIVATEFVAATYFPTPHINPTQHQRKPHTRTTQRHGNTDITALPPSKRAVSTSAVGGVPYYASACSGTSRYASACSCNGVAAATFNGTGATSTVTATATETTTVSGSFTTLTQLSAVTAAPVTVTETDYVSSTLELVALNVTVPYTTVTTMTEEVATTTILTLSA